MYIYILVFQEDIINDLYLGTNLTQIIIFLYFSSPFNLINIQKCCWQLCDPTTFAVRLWPFNGFCNAREKPRNLTETSYNIH